MLKAWRLGLVVAAGAALLRWVQGLLAKLAFQDDPVQDWASTAVSAYSTTLLLGSSLRFRFQLLPSRNSPLHV